MYKKLLVPLDGSKRAEAILPHAEELARCHDAQIIFLRVVELSRIIPVTPEGADAWLEAARRLQEEAQSYVDLWCREFREKKIEAVAQVESGPAVEKIVNCAEREEADLIAMASHGRTGLSRVFYGSVAAGVLQRVDRPILLIRS